MSLFGLSGKDEQELRVGIALAYMEQGAYKVPFRASFAGSPEPDPKYRRIGNPIAVTDALRLLHDKISLTLTLTRRRPVLTGSIACPSLELSRCRTKPRHNSIAYTYP